MNMNINITEIRGTSPKGKNILLLGGVHGNELTPIFALAHLVHVKEYSEVDFNKLTVINPVNLSGLENHVREMKDTPTTDLNRMLVEKDDTNVIELLKDHIDNNDVIIDVHSSPDCADFVLIDVDEYANSLKDLCDVAEVVAAYRYSSNNTIKRYCLDKGKVGITIELNGMDKINFDSAYNGIEIINKLIKKLKDISLIKERPTVTPMIEVKSHIGGLILDVTKKNTRISKGEILCDIWDVNLSEKHIITSPVDGIIICEPSYSYVSRGEDVFLIQPI
jgi:predicted deacylase